MPGMKTNQTNQIVRAGFIRCWTDPPCGAPGPRAGLPGRAANGAPGPGRGGDARETHGARTWLRGGALPARGGFHSHLETFCTF